MAQSAMYKPVTRNNYDMFECSSALQKAIRRGEEETAMFFAVELFISGFDEYVWKRLKIIVSEDIGIAELNLPAQIHALYEFYSDLKKKNDDKKPERLQLTHAVIMMCRANKSRLMDWAVMRYWLSHDEQMIPVPDYAFDKHNHKGRKMGRGWEHFFTEGTVLSPHVMQNKEEDYKQDAYILRLGGKLLDDEEKDAQTTMFD